MANVADLGRLAQGRPMLRESVALIALCTLDAFWTLYVVRTGRAYETNPLFAAPLGHSDAAFLLCKGASFLLPVAALELLRPLHPATVARALRACLVGYVALYLLGSLGLLIVR